MSAPASNDNRVAFRRRLLGTTAAALCAAITALALNSPASAQAPGKIPELASTSFAWLGGGEWRDPPAGMRGPIKNDPEFPYNGNNDRVGEQVTVRMGNWKDPVLKPWAAAQIQATNDEILQGVRDIPFTAQARCYPGGVPGQLLWPFEPVYFIQNPKEVWMIWQRDHMVRRVFLTDKHSETVKPSWFGESIGRYENGDTLIVDTIGLQTKNSYIDNWRTPHTEKLHVIERFKLARDGNSLEAFVTVDDPDAYNEKIHMVQRWRKVPNPLLEMVCAENNGDHFGKNLFPIPQAERSDF